MKRLLVVFAVLALAGAAFAEGLPAAKAGARTNATVVLRCDQNTANPNDGCGEWKTISTLNIKAPGNGKELLVGVSAQTVLTTLTGVASKGGSKATSTADAGIRIRVVMDPGPNKRLALPGPVVYDRRLQQLSAVLEGQIAACLSVDPLTGDIVLDEECVLAEGVELLQKTAGAHHFNFVLPDVTEGVHQVVVQAKVSILEQACTTDTTGSEASCVSNADALIRKLSMTVEQVRFVKDQVVELDQF